MGLKKYFIKHNFRENVEAEEIFLDSEAERSLEEKGKLERPIKNRNFIFLYILIVAFLAMFFLRAGYLQIIKGEYYSGLSQGNKLRIYTITAPRGIIYDRSNQPLVYNKPSFDLVIDLVDFLENSSSIQDEILGKIIEVAFSDEDENIDKLKLKIEEEQKKISQLVLAKNINLEPSLILESLVDNWSGVRLEKNVQRQYLFSKSFAHILGYTGQISPAELKSHPDYSLNAQIGKDGLERQYENTLRGESGQEQIEIDALGRTQNLFASKPPIPGQGLVLFVDGELQKKLYSSLEAMFEKLFLSEKGISKAAAVAIDPNNGGVLAMVSFPSFDSNLFAQGISQIELDSLMNKTDLPFLNRTVAGQYPPGSTLKPLIAASVLEEKVIGPYEQINCQGMISIVNQYNPEIVYRYPDWKVHGLTDIVKAIAESCNIYFYTVGGGYEQIKGLGVEKIKKYLQDFGLGQNTRIDLPYEEAGLIPDEKWKIDYVGEEWYLGDTYHLSIGQGDILTTPLQMAMAIVSIANGGVLYQPRLVDTIIDSEKKLIIKTQTKVVRDDFIQEENIVAVQKGMRQAVLTGSAIALSNLPVKTAGKTGTAQFGTQGKTHAWFVGYAPYDNPHIVLAILVEGGGEGHVAAVPVAKDVLEWYFKEEAVSQ